MVTLRNLNYGAVSLRVVECTVRASITCAVCGRCLTKRCCTLFFGDALSFHATKRDSFTVNQAINHRFANIFVTGSCESDLSAPRREALQISLHQDGPSALPSSRL